MLTKTLTEAWQEFLAFARGCCSPAEFQNWIEPIKVGLDNDVELVLEVPNVFVQQYLLTNYHKYLVDFFPKEAYCKLPLRFEIVTTKVEEEKIVRPIADTQLDKYKPLFNPLYTFEDFIEGPSNQFVKAAAYGIAMRPGKSYNPLFIHGSVGLGKTHLLHAIGHYIQKHHRRLKVHCMTTEGFINELVDNLRNKSLDAMKRYFRSVDVLLMDDIQFLRHNFEEEVCNMFEALIHQHKQIVVTSDKPPSELQLSARLIGRMEWGLVANIAAPDLETRVAILQYKAEKKGVLLPEKVAFFIAERIFQNVRQLEGALNRLAAYTKMMKLSITEETVQGMLGVTLDQPTKGEQVKIDQILKSVALMYGVSVRDLQSATRTKNIALPRQIAMYLAKEMINESLSKLASYFGGKTHSTLHHAWKKIGELIRKDEKIQKQVETAKRHLGS